VVLNAVIARKVPGAVGWDLVSEAAAEAADVAAGRVAAAAAEVAGQEEEEVPLKPKVRAGGDLQAGMLAVGCQVLCQYLGS
jgi:hypothetical protein